MIPERPRFQATIFRSVDKPDHRVSVVTTDVVSFDIDFGDGATIKSGELPVEKASELLKSLKYVTKALSRYINPQEK